MPPAAQSAPDTAPDAAPDSAPGDEIRFDRPGPHLAALPYRIAAAGHTTARAGAPFERQRFNQHVLIWTLAGAGLIRVGTRAFAARPGALVWLDTAQHYAHGCAPGVAAWRYLWLGLHGHGLEALFEALGVGADPLTPARDADGIEVEMRAAIDRLRAPAPDSAAHNNAAVARLVAFLVTARGTRLDATGAADTGMAALAARMRSQLAQVWSIADLAELAHLSAAQLHRRFRAAHGAAPMDWLRHERIHAAKGLLVGTGARIGTIAAACGYADPYHFSRDFARLTGQPPSAFRRSGGR